MEKLCPILKGLFLQLFFIIPYLKCLFSLGLALTSFVIDLFMAMFYNTVIAWAVYYLMLSFKTELPWKECDQTWNTLCCLPINNKNNMITGNFSIYSTNYQLSVDESFVTKVYPFDSKSIERRIVIFNNRKNAESVQNIGNQALYQLSKYIIGNDNFSLPIKQAKNSLNGTDTLRLGIENWINSYYVLVNETLYSAPKIDIPMDSMAKYFFDPVLLTNLIEEQISQSFVNQSVTVFLNCEKKFNNPTQEFYTRYLTEMHKSTGLDYLGGIKWEIIICLFLVFITVYFALWKGIKSAGKAVWITAIAPYIVMFSLLIRGLTLEGCWIGIKFYLSVDDWGSLLEMKVWVDAATQIFFSLGPGFGTIIALSSYNKRKNNCYKYLIF